MMRITYQVNIFEILSSLNCNRATAVPITQAFLQIVWYRINFLTKNIGLHEFCIERSFLKSQNCWLSVKKRPQRNYEIVFITSPQSISGWTWKKFAFLFGKWCDMMWCKPYPKTIGSASYSWKNQLTFSRSLFVRLIASTIWTKIEPSANEIETSLIIQLSNWCGLQFVPIALSKITCHADQEEGVFDFVYGQIMVSTTVKIGSNITSPRTFHFSMVNN